MIEAKLREINNFHPCLKFTIEKEVNGELPFLDMRVIRIEEKLSSTCYTKPTDTRLIMNFHSVSPFKYKKSVVSGSCTESIMHAVLGNIFTKVLLKQNQFSIKISILSHSTSPSFIDPWKESLSNRKNLRKRNNRLLNCIFSTEVRLLRTV